MAKVEMNIGNGGGTGPYGGEWDVDSSLDEYADKVWQESQLDVLVKRLTQQRKTMQRKIDAARKRLKRLTDRLNNIEEGWATNPA